MSYPRSRKSTTCSPCQARSGRGQETGSLWRTLRLCDHTTFFQCSNMLQFLSLTWSCSDLCPGGDGYQPVWLAFWFLKWALRSSRCLPCVMLEVWRCGVVTVRSQCALRRVCWASEIHRLHFTWEHVLSLAQTRTFCIFITTSMTVIAR